MDKFKEELGHIDWSDVLLSNDLEASCESFIETINGIKEKYKAHNEKNKQICALQLTKLRKVV